MIASLQGRIIDKNGDHIIVGVGGVGVQVYVTSQLREELSPGDQVYLHTHLIVREDLLDLYGFSLKEEKEFFTLLLGVNGVGPRLALASLTTLTPDAIQRAVFHEQYEIFSRIPGIGKKTAQKVLLHLQDKISVVDDLSPLAAMTDVDSEVLEALIALGYSVVEAQAAIQSIPKDVENDIETKLRIALQYF